MRERTYALSARGTGSPSLTKLRKSDFRRAGVFGVASGRSETGGAPKLMQWMRLKKPVKILSSDSASRVVESI
jgi:hypothetical protein